MKKFIISLVFLIFMFAESYSQEIEDIFTDRPDQTESPDILYKNFLQFEAGINYEKDNSNPGVKSKNYNIPEMLIRYGLNKFTELRLEFNFLKEEKNADGTFTLFNVAENKYLAIDRAGFVVTTDSKVNAEKFAW